jgi:hypothetical protein
VASIPLEDLIPDVRDGLTRKERMVLYCLREAQRDFNDRNVPTITLYGRVLEKVDMSQAEFQSIWSASTICAQKRWKTSPLSRFQRT